MDLLFVFTLGIVVGALVNRLGADLPARRPIQRPNCPYCDAPRPVIQWIALPTYVVGKGRCPNCDATIPIRYPLAELALGFLFTFLYMRYGATPQFTFYALYTTILVLITITDLERRLILNVVTFPAMVLALVGSFFVPGITWKSALLGGAIGYVTFYILALVGNLSVGPGALGGGDVTLAAFVGMITGFPLVVEALLLAILSGGIISLLLVLTKVRSMRDYIPYGPFLVLGGWVTLIWGVQIGIWFFAR
ncbi:MAG: prepilin peptidase [Anaerolineae bacterium]|nr:prepilin peptidase [Anaerolineae bacterium]